MSVSTKGHLVPNLILAIVYAILGIATLELGETGGVELRRVIWAASGVAVTAALLFPYRLWWGAGIGGAAATLLTGDAPLMVAGTGLANGLEVFLTVQLLRRVRFDNAMERVTDILALILLGSGVAALAGALISVFSLAASGGAPVGALPRVTLMWWLTHAIGIVVLTPVGLRLGRLRPSLARGPWLELLAVLAGVAVSTWLPFAAESHAFVARLFFLPFPFLLWAAVRLGVGTAALGALLASLGAIVAAVRNTGPFAIGTPNDILTLTWLFTNVVMIATLIASALVLRVEQARAAHEEGEARLQAVLDSAGEGIVVTDASRVVTHVNRAVGEMWPDAGAAPRLHAGVDTALATLVERSASPAVRDLLLSPPTAAGRGDTVEWQDGRVWEVQVRRLAEPAGAHARPEEATAGDAPPPGVVWSFRDVTERRRAEEERRQLQAQLLHGQKLESLGVMAGGIAHDFNNLLMAMRARADLIDDLEELDPEVREDVEAILRIIDQAAALCRQMLVYAGRGAIEVRTVDISSIARDIPELLRVSVSRQVGLALDLSAERLWVSGDATQLRQVALNLVTNASDAVEATRRGGSVTVSTRRKVLTRDWIARASIGSDAPVGEYCVLEVSDDGIGMSADTARQMFDPFFSSKGTGRGLGLSSVMGVVRRHRGVLHVESREGSGSRFAVALPATGAPDDVAEEATAVPEALALGGRTILVVDDDDEVRQAVTRMLERWRMTVRQAADGDQALDVLASDAGAGIDLVLLDLTMPRRSGPATLTEMRARGITTPVIIASGYSAEAVPEADRGAPFVQKPFRGDELRRAIANLLQPT